MSSYLFLPPNDLLTLPTHQSIYQPVNHYCSCLSIYYFFLISFIILSSYLSVPLSNCVVTFSLTFFVSCIGSSSSLFSCGISSRLSVSLFTLISFSLFDSSFNLSFLSTYLSVLLPSLPLLFLSFILYHFLLCYFLFSISISFFTLISFPSVLFIFRLFFISFYLPVSLPSLPLLFSLISPLFLLFISLLSTSVISFPLFLLLVFFLPYLLCAVFIPQPLVHHLSPPSGIPSLFLLLLPPCPPSSLPFLLNDSCCP